MAHNIEDIEKYVTEGYRNILKREPDPNGFKHYVSQISSGRISKERFLEILRTSREYIIKYKEKDTKSKEQGTNSKEQDTKSKELSEREVQQTNHENGRISIGWVADFTIDEHRGGAQQTNHEMVTAGRIRGYIVDYITPKKIGQTDINKFDLFIVNRMQLFDQNIKKLMIRKKYIIYEHDYDRIMLDPMCKSIYENSLLNIFLSPLHFDTFNEYYKKKYGKNIDRVYLQPSPVIGFKKSDRDYIKNTVIWVGDLQPHKGINNVIEYARKRKDLKFDFYILKYSHTKEINNIKTLKLDNISIKNEIKDKKEMNNIYSKYEYFIHLPKWKEPFGRSVLEAYLSGCKLIINDNVGMMSYGWNLDNYDDIAGISINSIDNFWKKIGAVLEKYIDKKEIYR